MTLVSEILTQITATYGKDVDLSGPVSYRPTIRRKIALANGVGAGQADKLFTDTRTLAASGTEDLDLAGSLTDVFGTTLTLARLKAIAILASEGNTNNVNVTRPASNGVPLFLAAGDGVPVRPGGSFLWACQDATGIAITAGTGDLLTVTNSAGSTPVTYDVVIIGASA